MDKNKLNKLKSATRKWKEIIDGGVSRVMIASRVDGSDIPDDTIVVFDHLLKKEIWIKITVKS